MPTIELVDTFDDDSLEMGADGSTFRVAQALQDALAATGPLTAAAPANVQVQTAAPGVSPEAAHADHKHNVATGVAGALAIGAAAAEGVAATLARSDHVHVLPGLATTTVNGFMPAADKSKLAGIAAGAAAVTNAAPADVLEQTASSGVAAEAARADHKHNVVTGMPAALAIGSVASGGIILSLSRSDHVHAMPAAGTPVGLTLAGANAPGSAATLARSDHVHAMPATAAPTTALGVNTAAAAGVAATLARSDHTHALMADGTPLILVPGGAASVGASDHVARADHKHPLAAFGSAAGTFCEGNDARLSAALVNPATNGFRLSTSNTDPLSSNGTFSTVYLTPYNGNMLALYSGGAWKAFASAGAALALSGLTANIPADVFAYDSGGVVTLERQNWSSATARAISLVRQDGAWVKSGDPTRRYIGTILPSGATQLIMSATQCSIWNVSNRVTGVFREDLTGSVNLPSGNTWYRLGTRFAYVVGLPEDLLQFLVQATVEAFGQHAAVGVGVDSETAPSGLRGNTNSVAGAYVNETAFASIIPGLGAHYIAHLAISATTAAKFWASVSGGFAASGWECLHRY